MLEAKCMCMTYVFSQKSIGVSIEISKCLSNC